MKDFCHTILYLLITCLNGFLWVLLPLHAQCQNDSYQESFTQERNRIRSLNIRSAISFTYGAGDKDSLFCSVYDIILYNKNGDLIYAEDAICCGPHFIRDVFTKRDKMSRNMDSTGNISKAFLLQQEKRHNSPKAKGDERLDDANFCYVHYGYEQGGKKILKTSFEPRTEFSWDRNETTYDTLGRLVSNRLYIGDRSNDLVLEQEDYYLYNQAGKRIVQYEPLVDSIVYVYDNKARLSQILRYGPNSGLGDAQVYNYSDTGYTVIFKANRMPLIDTDTIEEAYRIDQLVDRGYERYDTSHRMLESNLLNFEMRTVYIYDTQGRLISQIYNDKSHTDYEYDKQNRKSAMLSCSETSCSKWVYQYNELGEMIEEKEFINNELVQRRVYIYTHFR